MCALLLHICCHSDHKGNEMDKQIKSLFIRKRQRRQRRWKNVRFRLKFICLLVLCDWNWFLFCSHSGFFFVSRLRTQLAFFSRHHHLFFNPFSYYFTLSLFALALSVFFFSGCEAMCVCVCECIEFLAIDTRSCVNISLNSGCVYLCVAWFHLQLLCATFMWHGQ